MHRSSLTLRAVTLVSVGVACLAAVPAALADDGIPDATDPPAAAVALAQAAATGMPPLDPAVLVTELTAGLPVPAEPLVEPAPTTAPEAVAAAAVQPIPAMEPHPSTPPPPQPEVPVPTAPTPPEPVPVSEYEVLQPASSADSEDVPAPQYQPVSAQYQPDSAAPAAVPAPVPEQEPEQEWSWEWTWSCGGSQPPAQPQTIPSDTMPENWNWNWDWNCGPGTAENKNKTDEYGGQYQPGVTRYQPLNVNVSIRIGSAGDDGGVTQTNVILAVDAGPVSATVEAAAPAAAPAAPATEMPAAAAAPPAAAAAERAAAATKNPSPQPQARSVPAAQPGSGEDPSWAARPVVSTRLQRTQQEADRSRLQHRRPTRSPLPPRRAPEIPVGSPGASPLGGSDGGGFQFALLLLPFVLALVDSARRTVRDITPPVARAYRARPERPG